MNTQQFELELASLLASLKIKTEAQSAIIDFLNSKLVKQATTRVANPPQEIDGIVHYYCRTHQRYEPAANMVMAGGKSKGYCKAGASAWNARHKSIKDLEAKSAKLLLQGLAEDAMALAKSIEQNRIELNDWSTYDFDADWEAFTSRKKAN